MALKLITAGSAAVSLADAKAHLRVTDTAEDALVTAYISAAQAHVEQMIDCPLTVETWEQTLDGFPSGPIALLKRPLTTVASVRYDVNRVDTLLAASTYTVDLAGGRVFADSWPAADGIASVRVRFTAGFATVPAPLRAAVLLVAGDLYAHREGKVEAEMVANPAVKALVFPYRTFA